MVEITIPDTGGWPTPSNIESDDVSVPGGVTLGGSLSGVIPTVTATTMSATITTELVETNTIVFTYKNITAPTAGGTYTFTAKSRTADVGELKPLKAGATIEVTNVAAGSIALESATGPPLMHADPGAGLGNLNFTFTARAKMASGAQVQITIPKGWTTPFLDNNDGVDAAGEVSVDETKAELSVTGGGAQPWMVTATTTAALEVGNTLTIAYKQVTAPATETEKDKPSKFTTSANVAPGGSLLQLSKSPSVIVRDSVTAIAVAATPASVFSGDKASLDVTLWAGTAEGKAYGPVTVTLDDGEAGGTFTPASITIDDYAHSGTATYTNTTAGMVTITATSGEMTATADVDVKSTIRDLSVDNALVKQGATLMISATGKAGGGTVTVMDADGEKVGTTKALDPIDEVDADGDQEYSRSITLPATLADGTYTISVAIQGDTNNSLSVKVVNDQTPPAVSGAKALPDTVKNGELFTLSANVALPKDSSLTIKSVMADVSKLDSTKTDAVEMTEQKSAPGTYTAIITVDAANTVSDGPKDIVITAMDDLDNTGTATATVTLSNDDTDPVLSMASAMPAMAKEGTEVTISVTSEAGLTVTADATSIGGGAAVALTAPMAPMAPPAGGGSETPPAGGGSETPPAGGSSETPPAGGSSETPPAGGGSETPPAGGGMDASVTYTGTVPVTGAADGEQMITITAMDISGNDASATVFVTVDNTAPTLKASVDPASAANDDAVTISVTTETGATVTADASAIGGAASIDLAESDTAAGSYSGTATVTDATDGEQMISITAADALGNASDAVMVSVTVDNTAPALSMASVTPAAVTNGAEVTISVTTETGATVTADASAIGVTDAVDLAESDTTAGSYSGTATVNVTAGGDMAVSITASDALGNMSEAASATVSVHEVTSASFSPMEASTGDMVTVTASGSAGQTATFSVHDADGMNIVTDKAMTESTTTAGSYSGSFATVMDAHPEGVYSVSVAIGVASMMAEGSLTIDHLSEFTLTIPAGVHLIHIPLKVDGMDTVSDLHTALGDAVNYIITLGADGNWNSYLGASSAGTTADAAIGADTGLVAVMSSEATLNLEGSPHGADGASSITLVAGTNLVGVPLKPPAVGFQMISDVVTLPAITSVVVSNAAGDGFNAITQAGDPGDGPITGGTGYIVLASAAATIPVVGEPWENPAPAATAADMTANGAANGAAASAPSIGVQTPALHVQGKLIDNAGMLTRDGLTVSVRNVTSGTTLGSDTVTDEYSMTFVKLDTHAAKVGDVIEIRADSSNPLLGIRPVQYVVTSEDVLTSRISLPDLVTYEIPAQTELLANYPNPFNPETWIPFRLAKDASVTLTIYGTYGDVVRNIDIGFTPAAVYEGRSDAIYWDGRNDFGEQVASGIYFYHLTAGDFSATRKMVIVK